MTKDSTNPTINENISMFEALMIHSRADRTLRLIVSRALEKYDVTMMEWLLLGAVCEAGKEGASMSTVAHRLDVTLPQVTALATGLTKSKLVKQKISTQDRRSRKLTCTPAAKNILEEMEKSVGATIRDLVNDMPLDKILGHLQVIDTIASRKPEKA